MNSLLLISSVAGGVIAVLLAYYLFYTVSEASEEFGSRTSGRSWLLGLLVPGLLVGYGIYALA